MIEHANGCNYDQKKKENIFNNLLAQKQTGQVFYDGSGLAQTFQSIDSYKRMTNKNDNITTVSSEILTARHKTKHKETQRKTTH